jgi:hypothetical protein
MEDNPPLAQLPTRHTLIDDPPPLLVRGPVAPRRPLFATHDLPGGQPFGFGRVAPIGLDGEEAAGGNVEVGPERVAGDS